MKKVILLLFFLLLPIAYARYEISYQGSVFNITEDALTREHNLTIEINDSENNQIYREHFENKIHRIRSGLWGFGVIMGRNQALDLKYNTNYTLCTYVNEEVQSSCHIFNSGVGLIDSLNFNVTNNLNINNWNIVGVDSIDKASDQNSIIFLSNTTFVGDWNNFIAGINVSTIWLQNITSNASIQVGSGSPSIVDMGILTESDIYVSDDLEVGGTLYIDTIDDQGGGQIDVLTTLSVDDLAVLGVTGMLGNLDVYGDAYFGTYAVNASTIGDLNATSLYIQNIYSNGLTVTPGEYLKNNTDITASSLNSTNSLQVTNDALIGDDLTVIDDLTVDNGQAYFDSDADANNQIIIDGGTGATYRRIGFQGYDNGVKFFDFYAVNNANGEATLTIMDNNNAGVEIFSGNVHSIPNYALRLSDDGDINATRFLGIGATYSKVNLSAQGDINGTKLYVTDASVSGQLTAGDIEFSGVTIGNGDINISGSLNASEKLMVNDTQVRPTDYLKNGTDATLEVLNIENLSIGSGEQYARIFKDISDGLIINSSNYMELRTDLYQRMDFAAGQFFNWVDADASDAVRMQLWSGDGTLSVIGLVNTTGNLMVGGGINVSKGINITGDSHTTNFLRLGTGDGSFASTQTGGLFSNVTGTWGAGGNAIAGEFYSGDENMLGINYGIYATAENAGANYAGYFNGTLYTTNELHVVGDIIDADDGTVNIGDDLVVEGNDIYSSNGNVVLSMSNDDASISGCLVVGSTTECTTQGWLGLDTSAPGGQLEIEASDDLSRIILNNSPSRNSYIIFNEGAGAGGSYFALNYNGTPSNPDNYLQFLAADGDDGILDKELIRFQQDGDIWFQDALNISLVDDFVGIDATRFSAIGNKDFVLQIVNDTGAHVQLFSDGEVLFNYFGTDLNPDADSTRDLGSTGLRWKEVHLDFMYMAAGGDIRFWNANNNRRIDWNNDMPDLGGVTGYAMEFITDDTNTYGFKWCNQNECGMSLESVTGQWDLSVANEIHSLGLSVDDDTTPPATEAGDVCVADGGITVSADGECTETTDHEGSICLYGGDCNAVIDANYELYADGTIEGDDWLEHSPIYDINTYGPALQYFDNYTNYLTVDGELDHSAQPEVYTITKYYNYTDERNNTVQASRQVRSGGLQRQLHEQAIFELKQKIAELEAKLANLEG